MSGLLDSKQRVMDTLVTLQGRSQLANGGFRIAFVTFSDSTAYYLGDVASGSQDASDRVYLEASCLPQDMVTFEADDSGKLKPFPLSSGSMDPAYTVAAGQILSGSGSDVMDDETFASESRRLTESSLQNFKNMYVLGTKDDLREGEGDRFGLSQTSVTFNVDGSKPIDDQTKHIVDINDRESLFNDPRFSRIPNFRFMPPLRQELPPGTVMSPVPQQARQSSRHYGIKPNETWKLGKSVTSFGNKPPKVVPNPSDYQLGSYAPLGSVKPMTDEEVVYSLKTMEDMGLRSDVEFTPRPPTNTLLCQFFEKKTNTLLKLDVLDFGKVQMESGQHGDVYFVGKVVTDDMGTNTFIHLFTLVYESYTPAAKYARAAARTKAYFNP